MSLCGFGVTHTHRPSSPIPRSDCGEPASLGSPALTRQLYPPCISHPQQNTSFRTQESRKGARTRILPRQPPRLHDPLRRGSVHCSSEDTGGTLDSVPTSQTANPARQGLVRATREFLKFMEQMPTSAPLPNPLPRPPSGHRSACTWNTTCSHPDSRLATSGVPSASSPIQLL